MWSSPNNLPSGTGGAVVLGAVLLFAASLLLLLACHCACQLLRPPRHRMNVKYSELPTTIPQIKISVPSSASVLSVNKANGDCGGEMSAMKDVAGWRDACCPPWMLERGQRTSDAGRTPPSPSSPASSLGQEVNGDRRTTSRTGSFRFTGEDDEDMDERSVLHYELSFGDGKDSGCFRGTLTFALRYDFIHRVLMLHVLRAQHLPCEEKGRTVDPYVKMYLLPERRNHCKTKIDPEFNEMFSFDVSYPSLPNRMLQFTVYDYDRMSRHGVIGNIIMRDLFDKSDLYTWTEYTMQIVGSQEKNDFGDLLLYLCYNPNDQKLTVTVAKAYNLRPMDITGASDPYVRISQVYRGRRVKLRRTTTKKANLNPVYHESLEFDLPATQINETSLLVQVMDWDRIGRDDLLGCCILGHESPTPEGRRQWEETFAPNTEPKPKMVGTWHSILAEIPENYKDIPKARK